ncbi:MAG: hypothetical protein HGA25_09540, partial [Clostridiales bacterium]|nr:hypothetical protein [Clostridiales bacterium]
MKISDRKPKKMNFKTGIRKQILRISIPALLVPIFTIGFFLTYYLLQNTYTQAKAQMDSDNYRVRACVLDCLLDINSISDDIVSDTTLYDVLNTDYTGMNNI